MGILGIVAALLTTFATMGGLVLICHRRGLIGFGSETRRPLDAGSNREQRALSPIDPRD